MPAIKPSEDFLEGKRLKKSLAALEKNQNIIQRAIGYVAQLPKYLSYPLGFVAGGVPSGVATSLTYFSSAPIWLIGGVGALTLCNSLTTLACVYYIYSVDQVKSILKSYFNYAIEVISSLENLSISMKTTLTKMNGVNTALTEKLEEFDSVIEVQKSNNNNLRSQLLDFKSQLESMEMLAQRYKVAMEAFKQTAETLQVNMGRVVESMGGASDTLQGQIEDLGAVAQKLSTAAEILLNVTNVKEAINQLSEGAMQKDYLSQADRQIMQKLKKWLGRLASAVEADPVPIDYQRTAGRSSQQDEVDGVVTVQPGVNTALPVRNSLVSQLSLFKNHVKKTTMEIRERENVWAHGSPC